MYDLRLCFSKTGRAKYISHLDLMRTMQRAFLRAGLPIKYSEGFNPHAVMSIALPLPLFMESGCELMDFSIKTQISPEETCQKLDRALPEGLEALRVYVPETNISELKYHRIEGILEYDPDMDEEILDRLREFFSRAEIVVIKKTKRGEGSLNIAPHIKKLEFSAEDDGAFPACGVRLSAVLPAQGPTLSPLLLFEALKQLEPKAAPGFCAFKRLENLTQELSEFK